MVGPSLAIHLIEDGNGYVDLRVLSSEFETSIILNDINHRHRLGFRRVHETTLPWSHLGASPVSRDEPRLTTLSPGGLVIPPINTRFNRCITKSSVFCCFLRLQVKEAKWGSTYPKQCQDRSYQLSTWPVAPRRAASTRWVKPWPEMPRRCCSSGAPARLRRGKMGGSKIEEWGWK